MVLILRSVWTCYAALYSFSVPTCNVHRRYQYCYCVSNWYICVCLNSLTRTVACQRCTCTHTNTHTHILFHFKSNWCKLCFMSHVTIPRHIWLLPTCARWLHVHQLCDFHLISQDKSHYLRLLPDEHIMLVI